MEPRNYDSGTSDAMVPAPDLRAQLFQKLQSKGFLDILKSQLRRHLIHELTNSGQKLRHDDGTGRSTAEANKKPLSLKIANSLIVQHLEACQYDYTMSVFLPECGMTAREVLSTEEVSHYIRLELHGIDSKKDSKQSALWRMLSAVPKRMSVLECGTQTDSATSLPGVVGFLDQKLSAIDEHYNVKEDSSRKSTRLQIEERLVGYQRQMDKMTAEHVAREVERFRTTELSQIRAEEQHRFHQEQEKCRKEMEASYSMKLTALQERERSAFEKLQKDYELVGQETYRQRQQLLKQIEELRGRETDLRRQQESTSRESRLAEERLKKMEDLLHTREMSIVQKENEFDMQLKFLSDKIRAEERDKYEVRNKELQDLRVKLKDEEQHLRLNHERLLSSGERQELVEKRQRILQLESLVSKYTYELSTADANVRQLQERLRQTVDYDTLREANLVQRADLDHVKQRLAEVLKDNEKLRERHEQLVKEFGHKTATSMSSSDLLTFKVEMERLKDMAVQDKIIAEARLAEALAKLHAQMDQNRALVVEYEKQTDSMRGMNRLLTQSQRSGGGGTQLPSGTAATTAEAARHAHIVGAAADAAAVENRLGAPWVPYPADAARCLTSGDRVFLRNSATSRACFGGCGSAECAGSSRKDERCCGGSSSSAMATWDAGRCPASAADASLTTSEDNTASDSLVEDTRRRLRGLESEAERLQQALQSFTAASVATSPDHGPLGKGLGSRLHQSATRFSPPVTGMQAAAATLFESGHSASAFSRYRRSSAAVAADETAGERSASFGAAGAAAERGIRAEQGIRSTAAEVPASTQQQPRSRTSFDSRPTVQRHQVTWAGIERTGSGTPDDTGLGPAEQLRLDGGYGSFPPPPSLSSRGSRSEDRPQSSPPHERGRLGAADPELERLAVPASVEAEAEVTAARIEPASSQYGGLPPRETAAAGVAGQRAASPSVETNYTISLDSEWRTTSRRTLDDPAAAADTMHAGASAASRRPAFAQVPAESADQHRGRGGPAADTAGGDLPLPATVPAAPARDALAAATDENEGVSMNNSMQKYMQMMLQQQQASLQQQQRKEDELDDGEAETPSLSISASEQSNKTEEDQDRSDNFW